MKRASVVVVMGVSGSGKTTIGSLLARRLGSVYLEGDDFHTSANIEKMSSGRSLTDEDRMPWLANIKSEIDSRLESGAGVVVGCSALRQCYRRRLANDVSSVRFVYLKGKFSVISERMTSRKDHYMKPGMLTSQFASLEEPEDAIVVDIGRTPHEIVSYVEAELSRAVNREAD